MMTNIDALVHGRRSVRTYDERKLSGEDLEKLCAFMAEVDNPYGIPVEFRLLDAKEQNLSCPVVVETDLYVGAKMKNVPFLNEAVGYSFEALILYAQSLEIGTVWVGGTMDRGAFERAMELGTDEVMPCVSPLGYPAKKMSVRETLMRKGIKADARMAQNILQRILCSCNRAAGKPAGRRSITRSISVCRCGNFPAGAMNGRVKDVGRRISNIRMLLAIQAAMNRRNPDENRDEYQRRLAFLQA